MRRGFSLLHPTLLASLLSTHFCAMHVVAGPSPMIYSWGSNQYGQLGRGGDDSPYPVPCDAALQIPAPVVQLAVGGGHSVALAADGTVWTWGWNGKGQLGRSDKGSVIPAPGKVAGISECVFVAAGHEESLAIDSSGSLWSLGGGREQPVNVAEMLRLTTEELRLLRRETRTEEGMLSSAQQREGAEKIKFVHAASGVIHGAAVTSEGECVAWGKHNGGGGEGVLSRELPEGVMIWRPSDGAALVQVECGWRHTVARDSEGRVWTFGGGKSGNKWKQLGARAGPSADKAAVPAPLAGWGGDGDAPSARPAASKVAAGWSHTVVLSEVPPSLARATHAGPARALWG